MDLTPADHVAAAAAQVTAITDPVERARAITALIDAFTDATTELKPLRRDDVLKLRETLKLREVAAEIGVTIGRVDQIAKGR